MLGELVQDFDLPYLKYLACNLTEESLYSKSISLQELPFRADKSLGSVANE